MRRTCSNFAIRFPLSPFPLPRVPTFSHLLTHRPWTLFGPYLWSLLCSEIFIEEVGARELKWMGPTCEFQFEAIMATVHVVSRFRPGAQQGAAAVSCAMPRLLAKKNSEAESLHSCTARFHRENSVSPLPEPNVERRAGSTPWIGLQPPPPFFPILAIPK